MPSEAEWWVKRPYEIGGGISREGFPSEGWQGGEGWADYLSPLAWNGAKAMLSGFPPYSLPLFPLAGCAFALPCIVRFLC